MYVYAYTQYVVYTTGMPTCNLSLNSRKVTCVDSQDVELSKTLINCNTNLGTWKLEGPTSIYICIDNNEDTITFAWVSSNIAQTTVAVCNYNLMVNIQYTYVEMLQCSLASYVNIWVHYKLLKMRYTSVLVWCVPNI
jgi:hypothetical protein